MHTLECNRLDLSRGSVPCPSRPHGWDEMRRSAETDLILLDTELRRVASRASRQRRQIKASVNAWQRWSATIDAGLKIADLIEAAPASDITGLSIKLRAILWRLRMDEDVVLDDTLTRALRRLARDVSYLAR